MKKKISDILLFLALRVVAQAKVLKNVKDFSVPEMVFDISWLVL